MCVIRGFVGAGNNANRGHIIVSRARLLADLHMHVIASFLAAEFNKCSGAPKQLRFIDAKLVTLINRGTYGFCYMPPFFVLFPSCVTFLSIVALEILRVCFNHFMGPCVALFLLFVSISFVIPKPRRL